jgi:hypothetical protein
MPVLYGYFPCSQVIIWTPHVQAVNAMVIFTVSVGYFQSLVRLYSYALIVTGITVIFTVYNHVLAVGKMVVIFIIALRYAYLGVIFAYCL